MRFMIQSERCRAIRNGILLIILYAVIFFFSAEDGESSSAVSTQVTKTLLKVYYAMSEGKGTGGGVTGDLVYALEGVIRKLAHFTEYFCLGALWYSIPFLWKKAGRKSIPSVAGILLLSAAVDEFHQYFIPGRNASVRDVLIDVAGGMTAVAVLWIIKRLKRRLCTG